MEQTDRDEIVRDILLIILILLAVLVSVVDLDDIREFITWLGIKEEVKWMIQIYRGL